jgi:Domain of unknown function (DUF1877)
MILGLATLGDANIARVLADPPLVWRVIAPDDPEIYESARQQPAKSSFLGRLFGRAPVAEAGPSGEDFALADGEGVSTDLDKAWHGIHYLLTGTAWEGVAPLNFLVAGGRSVGDIDVGYGPARVLSAAETRAAHEALTQLSDDELRGRFDPAAMTKKDIYPEIWDRPPEEDDTLGYLLEYVRTLREFLAQAVEQRQGLVVSIR